MCSVAPFLLPGLAGVAPRAAPFLHARSTAAADMDALIRDFHAAVRARTPAADEDEPMSSAEFLGLSRPDHNDADFDLEAVLRGIRSIRVPAAAAFAPVHVAAVVATPTTPVASLPAPRSYDGDDGPVTAHCRRSEAATTTVQKPKQPGQGETYDAGIDATYRAMEKDPMERPSTDYLETTQAGGGMMMADRAELIEKMHRFTTYYELAPGTLHRAVSFVDRFLSAKRITGGDRQRQLRLLGATAVFAAAKYEDRTTSQRIDADAVAVYAGSTRSEVLDTERQLVAALGYRLSGPTAYTFVEHFTRHVGEDDDDGAATCRSLAHCLANLALLDYRCLGMLPSVVAASAVILAKLTLQNSAASLSEDLAATGYAMEDLIECMEAIEEMNGLKGVWPGCAQMMEDFELS